nr:recombinase family protein [Clostridium tyrobutyricum]
MGYNRNEYGELIINLKEAETVKRIFSEYLSGKGSFTIAKRLNRDSIPTVGNKKWHDSTVSEILKNEKYKGDAILQKYCILDHLKKKKIRNNGEVDSYYIEDNHSPIISRDVWERVQKEIRIRAEAKGNFKGDKYKRRYALTGKLYCSKCGAVLRRRTWNSKFSCRKIVWQCSNYIENGKNACRGTVIDDETAGRLNIKEEIIVREEFVDGKKHYSYSCKNKQKQPVTECKAKEKENGSLLQSINRPIRTVIKL